MPHRAIVMPAQVVPGAMYELRIDDQLYAIVAPPNAFPGMRCLVNLPEAAPREPPVAMGRPITTFTTDPNGNVIAVHPPGAPASENWGQGHPTGETCGSVFWIKCAPISCR